MAEPALTKYVVLEAASDAGNTWDVVGRVAARDGNAAIKAKVQGSTASPDGVYIAVPERSWQPVKVTAKVETTLVLAEVTA